MLTNVKATIKAPNRIKNINTNLSLLRKLKAFTNTSKLVPKNPFINKCTILDFLLNFLNKEGANNMYPKMQTNVSMVDKTDIFIFPKMQTIKYEQPNIAKYIIA